MTTPESRAREVWTRAVGHSPARDGAEDVIVVPPDAAPAVAIGLTRSPADRRGPVRIVGRGVTASSFTSRLTGLNDLLVTELDAYLPADKRAAQRALTAGLARWLDDVFTDAVPGLRGQDTFWSSVATRLGLQDVFDAWCFALGLAEAHPSSRFVITEPSWLGGAILASLVRSTGGVVEGAQQPRTSPISRLKLAVFSGVGALGALAARTREFIQEAPTRRFLKSLRRPACPRVWLGVNGAWEYSSRHIIEPLGGHATETGEQVGLMLQSSLRPGNLGDAHQSGRTDAAILPVLGSKALEGAYSTVEQVVSHETWAQFLAAAPRTLVAMLRCGLATATRGAEIDFGPFRLPLAPRARALVRAVTLDVLRGREAAAATRRVVERVNMSGAAIALSQASLVADAVPDLVLQSAGATTFDVVHGALAEPLDMVSTARTLSTRKLLWTHSEASYLAAQGRNTCRGALPPRRWVARERRQPHRPLRALVLSNYATLVGGGHRRRLPRLGYQEHLLENVRTVASRQPSGLELRWRPHPGDDRAEIQRSLATFGPQLELSTNRQLELDLEWADLFITSLSSTVVEALAWEKPLLLHDVPIHEADVLMRLFATSRRFRNAAELEHAVARAIGQLEGNEPLVEEESLRREFFGPTGAPTPLATEVFAR